MFGKIIELFKGKKESELVEAERDFDKHMAEVDRDIADLVKPDNDLEIAYRKMHGNVASIRKRVDEVVGDKAA